MKKQEYVSLRWWIFEDALRDHRGHWFDYLRTFQSGLEKLGDSTRFFASKECTDEVKQAFSASPSLPRSIWARMSDRTPKWRRFVRIFSHGFATYLSGLALLKNDLPDIIFVPTVLVHHLVGWVPLIKWCLKPKKCHVLLFFPNAPIALRSDGTPYSLSDPSAKLFVFLLKLLRNDVASGKVILAAETQSMTMALTSLTGVSFKYLPHPVEIDLLSTRSLCQVHPVGKDNPVVFGCYGQARHEKGSDILQQAIRTVLEDYPDIPARFIFQWGNDFLDANGAYVRLDPWLSDHPKVEILQGYISCEQYETLLQNTDVLLLPYRSPYRLRVSRVVIEALIRGLPTIVTQDTTLFDQASEFSAVKGCLDGSPSDLATKIVDTIHDFDLFSHAARSQAEHARNHFSVSFFRKQLIEYSFK